MQIKHYDYYGRCSYAHVMNHDCINAILKVFKKLFHFHENLSVLVLNLTVMYTFTIIEECTISDKIKYQRHFLSCKKFSTMFIQCSSSIDQVLVFIFYFRWRSLSLTLFLSNTFFT